MKKKLTLEQKEILAIKPLYKDSFTPITPDIRHKAKELISQGYRSYCNLIKHKITITTREVLRYSASSPYNTIITILEKPVRSKEKSIKHKLTQLKKHKETRPKNPKCKLYYFNPDKGIYLLRKIA